MNPSHEDRVRAMRRWLDAMGERDADAEEMLAAFDALVDATERRKAS